MLSGSMRQGPDAGAGMSATWAAAAPAARSETAITASSSNRERLSVIVRLTREDLVRPVELLEQHDPGELVGQRHRSQRDPLVGALELDPERAADDEGEIAPGLAALRKETAEAPAVEGAPAGGEQHDERPLGQPAGDPFAVAQLDLLDARVAGEQAAVVGDVVLVGRAQSSDAEDGDARAAILRA